MSLEEDPLHIQPLDDIPTLAEILIIALWEILKQTTQLSHAQTPDTQKLWDHFKMLDFLYYTEADDTHDLQMFFPSYELSF